jgi:hypothetical protein
VKIRSALAIAATPVALAACAATASAKPDGAGHALVPCRTQLKLVSGGQMSMMTGEHAELLGLINTGKSTCVVIGYPGVELYTASGMLMPFRYTHGGQYVGHSAPRAVTLRPGQRATLLLAKYRCDLGDGNDAVSVHLTFADGGKARGRLPITGSPGFSYCAGPASDPGHLVQIGPVTKLAS